MPQRVLKPNPVRHFFFLQAKLRAGDFVDSKPSCLTLASLAIVHGRIAVFFFLDDRPASSFVLGLPPPVSSPSVSRHLLRLLFHPSRLGFGVEASSGSRSSGSGDLRPPEEDFQAEASDTPSVFEVLQ